MKPRRPKGSTIRVELTPDELDEAALVGKFRQRMNRRAGRGDRHGLEREQGLEVHIRGAEAELAASKALRVPWTGRLIDERDWLRRDEVRDVGDYEIRSTPWKNGALLIHKSDPDEIFVLVVDQRPVFVLVGWIRAAAAKVPNLWGELQAGRPCYVVPQKLLRPMFELTQGEQLPLVELPVPRKVYLG